MKTIGLPLKQKFIENTPFGPVGIIWAEMDGVPRVVQLLLQIPELSGEERTEKLYPEAEAGSCPEIERVADGLREILEGSGKTAPLETAALELCSPFQRAVLRAAFRIPRGTVATYRGLAESLGRERAARAVGNALAGNPFPLIVPCHRIIRSDGRIGGFTGGEGMKRRLLELEGIRFDGSRVARAFLPVQ